MKKIFLTTSLTMLLSSEMAIAVPNSPMNQPRQPLDPKESAIKAGPDVYDPYSYEADNSCYEPDDPLEKLNRKIFAFNSFLDYVILKPMATAYIELVHEDIRTKVGHFTDNIQEPITTFNNVAQFNFGEALKSFWRFMLNSTFGVLGTHDFAAENGLKTPKQTFGSTLARYGVAPGPYLVLPIFGSTNARDATSLLVDPNFNVIKRRLHKDVKTPYNIVKSVNDRAKVLGITNKIAKTSPDPYASIRTMSFQNSEKDMRYPAGTQKCYPQIYKK